MIRSFVFLASKRDLEKKEAVTQLQLKKLKAETKASNSFDFKGNKVQFEFNTRLFGAVEAASKNILKGNYSAANLSSLKERKRSPANATSLFVLWIRVPLGAQPVVEI